MNDGIIKSNNFTFRYKDGDVVANMVLAMQGRPDLKLGFSVSGININDIIQSPLNGYVSLQFNCKTYGFNPVQFIKKINGKGKFVIQNIKIPHFDLLNTSNEIIKHGIGQDVDYYGMILNKPLLFNIGEGNLFLENGIVKGNISLSRELVSGSANFEYNLYSKTLNKLASSFAMMMVRKRFETPFPIYITIACSGKVVSPECLFNWEQLKSLVG